MVCESVVCEMAVFLINICKFNGCGIKFDSLGEFITHIENIHIGSEIDDEEMIVSESENSNDSWTTEEFSSEFIMRYGSRHSGTSGNSASNEKPFACPVPGCKKRYKNVNGIKYPSKNGHKKEGKVRKGFKCYCGKSYKTSQGLKNHSLVVHNVASTETLNARPLSPSSGSIGGNSYASQSQLSPKDSTNGNMSSINTNSLTTRSSPTLTQSVTQTNQISLKTQTKNNLIAANSLAVSSSSNNSHALLPTHNPNKLVKLNSECFDSVLMGTKSSGKSLIITSMANGTNNSNIIVSAPTSIQNASTPDESGNGPKINLPSLVNLGILTPATSPKQHTQLTPQISPNHMLASNASNNGSSSNNNNKNNNESSLPLTPISPLNKTLNGTASANSTNATNSSSNNNIATSPNLNNHGLLSNSVISNVTMTEDT